MISHFFIDRPIFATVLSIVITLTGGIALLSLPIAQYPQITPPSINVSISYPGASAQIVADTVGAPIEQQVTGVENMLYMSSQSGNDGSYSLSVTFDVGTNLNTALVMVQNRVMLAMPLLPTEVQNQGISIRKRTPDILMIVSLYSPDHRYDDLYLSNYADDQLPGRGAARGRRFGRQYFRRAGLQHSGLARSAEDGRLGHQCGRRGGRHPDARISTCRPGKWVRRPRPPASPGRFPIDALGRLSEPEQFGNIIVKVGPTSAVPMSTVASGPVQSSVAAVAQAAASPLQTAAGSRRVRRIANVRHDGHSRPGPRLCRHAAPRRSPAAAAASTSVPAAAARAAAGQAAVRAGPPPPGLRRRRSAAARRRP